MSKNDDSAATDMDAALAGLTEEERAALNDDDYSAAERQSLEELAGDDDDQGGGDDDDDDDDDDGSDDDGQGDDQSSGDGTGSQESDESASAQDDDDDGGPVLPRYQVSLPDDFKDRIQALDDQEAELARKFQAGEVEANAFLAENRRISKERQALEKLETKAEIAQEFNAQAAEQEWVGTANRFMRTVKAKEGIDYRNGEMSSDFDAMIKTLAANPKYEGKSYQWFLEQAHKATKALHGIADKPAQGSRRQDDGGQDAAAGQGKPAAGKPQPKPVAKPAARKPPVDHVPKTLADVPGGDGPGDIADEFADIDKLDGLEFETALASMSPAQRERYLKAA